MRQLINGRDSNKFTGLDKHIRCKCRKYYGMRNFKRECKRCKSKVIARGENG